MRQLLVRSRMVKDVVFASYSTSNTTDHNYKEIIGIINSLVSNAKYLEDAKKRCQSGELPKNIKLQQMVPYLKRCGLTEDKLDALSVIHIAGTKGKGSTSAFCESILRHHGYRTGFFSSPHLVSVRERVRIDGRPLNRAEFTAHARHVYDCLYAQREDDQDVPNFFTFTCLMAFRAFVEENVDVAIVEVGIGGEYDCTNVLSKVAAVGITSLGIDHTALLGNTIEEIAWQKAGIMKAGSVAFSSAGQPAAAMKVLRERSAEKQCPLRTCPPLDSYDWGPHAQLLGIPSDVQKVNASLALQLANHWIRNHGHRSIMNGNVPNGTATNGSVWNEIVVNGNAMNGNGNVVLTNGSTTTSGETAEAFPITASMARGLKYCQWPGRTQTITCGNVRYFLDGAHTLESMQVCTDWFRQMQQANQRNVQRVLIFNTTGDRDSSQFLEILFSFDFHLVIFCPNNARSSLDPKTDQVTQVVPPSQQLAQCEKHRDMWRALHATSAHRDSDAPPSVRVLPCAGDATRLVQTLGRVDVLVTGSLHLVGSVLGIVDPDLTFATHQAPQRQALLGINGS